MKKKRQRIGRLSNFNFVLLSMLIHGLAIGSGTVLSFMAMQNASLELLHNLGYLWEFVDLLPIILMIIGQSLLIQWQFRWSASKWFIASLIGVTTVAIWSILQGLFVRFYLSSSLSSALSLLPVIFIAICQYLVLRNYVKRAWLWLPVLPLSLVAGLPLVTSFLNHLASLQIQKSILLINFINTGLGGVIIGLIFASVLSILPHVSAESKLKRQNQHTEWDKKENHLTDTHAKITETQSEELAWLADENPHKHQSRQF